MLLVIAHVPQKAKVAASTHSLKSGAKQLGLLLAERLERYGLWICHFTVRMYNTEIDVIYF